MENGLLEMRFGPFGDSFRTSILSNFETEEVPHFCTPIHSTGKNKRLTKGKKGGKKKA
jgi:hypothetical protein